MKRTLAGIAVIASALVALTGCSAPSGGDGTSSGSAPGSGPAPAVSTVGCPEFLEQFLDASEVSTFDIAGAEWTPSTAPSCVRAFSDQLYDGNNEDYSVEIVLADYVSIYAFWVSEDDLGTLFAEAQAAIAAAGLDTSDVAGGLTFSTPQSDVWFEGGLSILASSQIPAEYGLDPGFTLMTFEITSYTARN